jgi:outer membrane protein W
MYAAYSFLSANAKFNPYAGAEVNYQPSGDDAFVNLGPYIGVRYFVTERINIDTNANWLINLGSTYGNDIRNSGLNVSPALNINVGVGVVLGKIL